ncbi:MAG: aspartate/glutamate racemase family protein [Ndongobacter sp.]|nr:aspartate/glutamate racemase family protein [Ndongobacter sp.]
MKKIAVVAGTLVDTEMGARIIEQKGLEAVSLPMSRTCEEQANMQYFSKEALEKQFEESLCAAREQGAEQAFLYCNSLSGAIDYRRIREKLHMNVVSPLDTYEQLPAGVKNVVVLAANGLSAYNIEKIIRTADHEKNVIAIGWLPLVHAIETGASPKKIAEELNLKGLVQFLEGISQEQFEIDSILLGCTHFPYIKEELAKLTELRVIDPAEEMLKRLKLEE